MAVHDNSSGPGGSGLGGQAGQEIQAGGMLELVQRLRQDFVQLQQDLAQERQARMQLEDRVNDIQQQLQQDGQVSDDGSAHSLSSVESENSEDIDQQILDAIERLAEMDREHREQEAADQELQAQVAQVARAFSFVIGWALLAWYASGLVN